MEKDYIGKIRYIETNVYDPYNDCFKKDLQQYQYNDDGFLEWMFIEIIRQ